MGVRWKIYEIKPNNLLVSNDVNAIFAAKAYTFRLWRRGALVISAVYVVKMGNASQ